MVPSTKIGIQFTKVKLPSESLLYKNCNYLSACNFAILYLYKEIKFKPNGFAMANNRAAMALGKTYLYTTIPLGSLVQIQYNSAEMFIIMPPIKLH